MPKKPSRYVPSEEELAALANPPPTAYYGTLARLPRLFKEREARDYVAGPMMMELLTKEFGLEPIIKRKGLVLYDRLDLDAAIRKHSQRYFDTQERANKG